MRVHRPSMSDDGRMHAQREEADPSASEETAVPAHPYPTRSPASGPGGRRSRRSAGEPGIAAGPNSACRPGTPTADLAGRPRRRGWFGRTAPLVLEIGCGTGISTLAMAAAEPDLDVIAVEVYRRGLAQLLSGIDREGLTNVRLIRGDGVDVLEHMLGTGVAHRRPGVLPRPVAQGAPPQAPAAAAATVALIADRLRTRWGPARRHRSRRVRRADRRGRRRRAAACAGWPRRCRRACRSRRTRPVTKYEARPSTPAAPSPNSSGRDAHERHRRHRSSVEPIPETTGAPTPIPAPQRVLLVWDAPNLDMGLGSILGGRPTAAHRPRFDALGRWLLARTAELSAARADENPQVMFEPEATVFTNIAPGQRRRRPPVGGGAAQRRLRGVRQTQDR